MDLNDSTMPFWFGGYLYVAATVFRESGVGYSYNIVSQTLVLYDSSRSLVFDVATGSGTDGQGNLYDHVCVTRGGKPLCGLARGYSFCRFTANTRVNHGYLFRVKSKQRRLPDSMFTETAPIKWIPVEQYQKKNSRETPDRGLMNLAIRSCRRFDFRTPIYSAFWWRTQPRWTAGWMLWKVTADGPPFISRKKPSPAAAISCGGWRCPAAPSAWHSPPGMNPQSSSLTA